MHQCAQCGLCCHSHSVLITFRDMQELMQNHGELDPLQTFVIYEARSQYIDEYKLENYPIIHIDTYDNTQTVSGYLALRFKADANAISSCIFFDHDGRKCTIHLHKPWICRAYPHTFDEKQKICFGKGRCPSEWMYDSGEIPQKTAFIRQAYQAYDIFKDQANSWNELPRPRTFEKLLQFVLNLNNATIF